MINRSILLKTAIPSVFIALISVVTLSFYFAYSASSRDERSFQSSMQSEMGLLAGSMAESLWNFDPNTAEAAMKPLLENQDFLFFSVLDDKGRPFVSLSNPLEERAPELLNLAVEKAVEAEALQAENLLVTLSPIIHPDSGKAVGSMVLGRSTKAISEARTNAIFVGIGLALAISALLSVALVLLLRRITRAIGRLTGSMTELAEGQVNIDVPYTENKDELGAIAHAMLQFKTNELKKRALEEEQRANEAREREKQIYIKQLVSGFEEDVHTRLARVVENMELLSNTSSNLNKDAVQTVDDVSSVSQALRTASENSNTVAAATEELRASIKEISSSVTSSVVVVEKANEKAEAAKSRMTGLLTAAEEIQHVAGLIEEIAEQTNLLALNATIEAARAGEAGKGFSVVAAEVKTLANQTAKATEEIRNNILKITEVSEQSVAIVNEITSVVSEMLLTSATISAAMEEQDAVGHDISSQISYVASAISDIEARASNVAERSQMTKSSAFELGEVADVVNNSTASLRILIEDFRDGLAKAG